MQRAVMISMFQAMAPDEEFARISHQNLDGEDEVAAQERLEESLKSLPSVVVAIEEPEIYQHPIRARAFARTLKELSEQVGVQVVLATHSPFFVQPDQFGALHRFTYLNGETETSNATVVDVAQASGLAVDKVEKAILSTVPTEFSEGFFADSVVLVEGQTDRVVLEALAAKLGKDLDSAGVAVLSVEGKGGLPVANAILCALGVPTFVVADGDFGTAARKSYHNKTPAEINSAIAQAHSKHQKDTEALVSTLPVTVTVTHGSAPYVFGAPSVVCDSYAVWRDDIEEELGCWVSFEKALSAEGVDLAARSNKNLLAYRNAVGAADCADLPRVLSDLIDQVVRISSGGSMLSMSGSKV
ncbi:ATP-dependent OLD family endonuclease [Dietzia cinnamea P4]|nr:ATP-dependent OLD family endonuclease [Dietzia cinnamea P4]